MDARDQVAASVDVRHVGDQEGVTDSEEEGHQEHHDDGVEWTLSDSGPALREGHDQHHSGEGEAGKAGHHPHVHLRGVVEHPWMAIELS